MTYDPDCWFGDHDAPAGKCLLCDYRVRCSCGVFGSNAPGWWENHAKTCRFLQAQVDWDREQFERTLP